MTLTSELIVLWNQRMHQNYIDRWWTPKIELDNDFWETQQVPRGGRISNECIGKVISRCCTFGFTPDECDKFYKKLTRS